MIKDLKFSNIKGIEKVIPQETLDYTDNLLRVKYNFVSLGDDWKERSSKNSKSNQYIKGVGGELIEVEYTEIVSSTSLNNALKDFGAISDIRRSILKGLTGKAFIDSLMSITPIGLIVN